MNDFFLFLVLFFLSLGVIICIYMCVYRYCSHSRGLKVANKSIEDQLSKSNVKREREREKDREKKR